MHLNDSIVEYAVLCPCCFSIPIGSVCPKSQSLVFLNVCLLHTRVVNLWFGSVFSKILGLDLYTPQGAGENQDDIIYIYMFSS